MNFANQIKNTHARKRQIIKSNIFKNVEIFLWADIWNQISANIAERINLKTLVTNTYSKI